MGTEVQAPSRFSHSTPGPHPIMVRVGPRPPLPDLKMKHETPLEVYTVCTLSPA
jgi:hypothetical protein